MVVKEFLDSDRVNFLIWRYLLEGNYRETAAKLQKEWHIKEPHRDFDFARHVKGHALVNVINRGLLYNGLEREHARHKISQDAAAEAEQLQVGIFGPLEPHPTAKVEEDDVTAADGVEESRKRLQHSLPNGSPAKRPRLSNGFDGAAAEPGADTTPMDVDSHQDNHAYPSPGEVDTGPTPATRTEGPDQGTQVDKVEELLPSTTFLKLVDDDASIPAAAEVSEATATPSSPPAPTGENAPVLLQCEWSPRDPSLLAAAGTDALARVWTVSRVTAPETSQDHVSPQFHAMLDRSTPKSTTVTALTWASDGERLAIATDAASQSVISVWGLDGTLEQEFEITDLPVIKLSWNPINTALLAISPDKTGAMVAVYDLARSAQHIYPLPGYDIASSPLDATWTSDSDVLLCGGDVLVSLHCTDQGIAQSRKFETRPEDSFRQVLFDWRSKLAATSSDKGNLDLWDESGQRREISAHRGAITTMAWQPLPANQVINDDERLIATGGEDCAILIWNARMPESKPKWFRTMDGPIVRLAFTPDGAFIAGATATKVLIWKVGNYTSPRAIWTRPATAGWMSPKTTSDTDEEDEHCLCWDASGQKLAYGSSSKLAVINFSR
ncbi:hypothetical protein NLU13_6377 [Sarocladium strictum]|uniref:Uncharacterized protein n=1 Tax=Sarocladium strictum TaxID=5046 RepID=A0AA39GFS4_SARSR|nr:hypothetical protein NLU13_6377 [Sarocladium strictum]